MEATLTIFDYQFTGWTAFLIWMGVFALPAGLWWGEVVVAVFERIFPKRK